MLDGDGRRSASRDLEFLYHAREVLTDKLLKLAIIPNPDTDLDYLTDMVKSYGG